MKKLSMSKKILILCSAWLWSNPLWSADYNYAELQIKNFDEMQTLVNARVKKAEGIANQNVSEAKNILKDALQLIFSRPNSDNIVTKLVAPIRSTLKNIETYELTLDEIATSAISQAQSKKGNIKNRATSFVVLANLMSELQPEVKSNPDIRKIFIKIRDAKIEVQDAVKSEMRMRAMLPAPTSPSAIATKVLNGQ